MGEQTLKRIRDCRQIKKYIDQNKGGELVLVKNIYLGHDEESGIYNGHVLSHNNEVRHGYGSMKYESGVTYEGFWENNVPNGRGKFEFPSGDIY